MDGAIPWTRTEKLRQKEQRNVRALIVTTPSQSVTARFYVAIRRMLRKRFPVSATPASLLSGMHLFPLYPQRDLAAGSKRTRQRNLGGISILL